MCTPPPRPRASVSSRTENDGNIDVQLLASNLNTYRAMQQTGPGSAVAAAGAGGGKGASARAAGAGGAEGGGGEGRVTEGEMKTMIEAVLASESLDGRRAASMDVDDLLALLSAFNEKGVHFA